MATSLSLSVLTVAFRSFVSRGRLQPLCRSMSVFHPPPLHHHHGNAPAHSSSLISRTAHFSTPPSSPPSSSCSTKAIRSTWPQSSVLGGMGSGCGGRSYSTHSAAEKSSVGSGGEGGSVKVSVRGREVSIPWLWLRDHCRCPSCYNADTSQKNVDNYSLDNVALHHSSVQGDLLSVQWHDGHRSEYSLQWLADNFHSAGFQAERFLWDGPGMTSEQLPVTAFDLHMNTEEGLKTSLRNLVKYGFCVVDGAPVSAEGTQMVTDRISFPLQTLYGLVSIMVSGKHDYSDTAYTNLPLGAHTDTTYLSTPAGVQVFHCLEHQGEGGSTLLVDGFHAAEELRRSDPEAFQCLTTTPVPHEMVDARHHYHLMAVGPVLTTNPVSGQMTHIRFNPYDRAALRTVSEEEVGRFYSSYQALTSIIRSPRSEFWLKLRPGMVLMVDNWRVMHGRSGFTGRRTLCSFYLPRDDWTSCARTLGLLGSA